MVQVDGNRKLVQHLEGGIISEIYVSNGDRVQLDEALIRIDSTTADAEKNIIEGRRWQKRALLDRLLSERDELSSIKFSPWLLKIEDPRAKVAIENEIAVFEARLATRQGETDVLLQQIQQLQSQIAGLTSVHKAKDNMRISYRAELSDLNELLLNGYVDKQRIRELERTLAQLLGEMEEITTRLAAAEVKIVELRLKITQQEKRFKTEVVDTLSSSHEQFYDLEQQLRALIDRLARTVIRAPADGEVLGLKQHPSGAIIKPGEEIMAIVPDVQDLVIDTRLSPMDIDRLRVGQEAEVRFAVFKDAYTVTGTLDTISADHLIDEMSGQPYFQAKVRLLPQDLNLLGGAELVPGMPADVLIKTGTRTFVGYLTSPLRRMFENSFIED